MKAVKLTRKERAEMKELEKIWKEIDSGKAVTLSKKEFFKEMKKW